MEQKLLGKVALVTGAGRGLGRAYALHLAKLGADVVVNDINLQAHKEYDEELTAATVPEEIEAMGRRSLGIEADVTKKDQVDAMFGQVKEQFGRLDVLVNNAGGALRRDGPLNAADAPEDIVRFILDVNLMDTIFCCQAAAKIMKEQGSGKIINIGSQAGMHAPVGGNGMPYSISKAGVIHFTRLLASDLGPHNINVNCIAPAWILSSRAIAQGRNEDETRERLESQIALGRLGMPEDVAKVVEFFATDLSDYVTGQTLSVCGGYVMFH